MFAERLAGKTAVITGGSSGVGKALAIELANRGMHVIIGARDVQKLLAVKAEIGTAAFPIVVDVTCEQSVRDFCEQAVNFTGKVDALINCAGNGSFAPLLELEEQDFDDMIAVNLRGTFLCCKYFGRIMAEQREGKILNIASIAGTTALRGCGGYSASKFGVIGMTRVLQQELRGQGVQITAVLPGSIRTPFWNKIENSPNPGDMLSANTVAQHIAYILHAPPDSFIDEISIMPPLGIL